MDRILVSKTPEESIYFLLKPSNPALDGQVVRGEETIDVPFWSYIYRADIKPIMDTEFHKKLWNGSTSNEEWVQKFYTREVPFSKEDLASMQKRKG